MLPLPLPHLVVDLPLLVAVHSHSIPSVLIRCDPAIVVGDLFPNTLLLVPSRSSFVGSIRYSIRLLLIRDPVDLGVFIVVDHLVIGADTVFIDCDLASRWYSVRLLLSGIWQ